MSSPDLIQIPPSLFYSERWTIAASPPRPRFGVMIKVYLNLKDMPQHTGADELAVEKLRSNKIDYLRIKVDVGMVTSYVSPIIVSMQLFDVTCCVRTTP